MSEPEERGDDAGSAWERLDFAAAAGAAQDGAHEVLKAVGAGAVVAWDWAEDQGEALTEAVQSRPLVTLGLTFGAAFLAGLLIGVAAGRRSG